MAYKLTDDEIELRLQWCGTPLKLVRGSYKGGNNKTDFRCKCGNVFSTRLFKVVQLRTLQCPECRQKK